ncbi:oligosaccharide flippase family protein [Shewanella sp.]|uniref:oligosaccharide flippase family protein n=1 Tax=Shewanella sp. TaxID=50422 RepID=UPI003A973ADC
MKALIESIFSKGCFFVLQFLTLMVLSRFVDKQFFGTFSIINSLYFFCIILSEAGGMQQIINAESADDERRVLANALVTSIRGAVIMVVLLLVFPLLYQFKVDNLAIALLAAALMLYGVASALIGLLYKQLKFFKVAVVECTAELISLLGAVLVGLSTDFDMNVLVVKVALYSFIRVTWLFVMFRQYLHPQELINQITDRTAPKSTFSRSVTSSNIVSFFVRYGDNLLIGRLFSIDILSLYDRAYQLTKYPVMLLSFSLQPAIQPLVKKLQSLDEVRAFILKLNAVFLVFGSLLFLFIYFYAAEIISLVLGDKWLDARTILVVLSFSIPFQAIYSISGGVYYGLGQPQRSLKINILLALFLVSAISISSYIGNFNLCTTLISGSFVVAALCCFLDIWFMEREMFLAWSNK